MVASPAGVFAPGDMLGFRAADSAFVTDAITGISNTGFIRKDLP
jgi:hypothetical protein